MTFTHLHAHSHYSILDGLDSPTELVRAAKALGQPALAITDHGTLSAHRELYRAAKEEDIKPIFGLEAYLSATDRFDRRTQAKRDDGTNVYNHIILLAKNQKGYENISAMSTEAWETGFFFKPRIDMELLEQYSEGVIALTGCLSGIAGKALQLAENFRNEGDNNSADRAKAVAYKWLLRMKSIFGEDLYVEVQAHNGSFINNHLLDYADELAIKSVATSDCHRAHKHDKDLQDAFLILSTKPKQDKTQNYGTTDGKPLLERLNLLYPERTMSFQKWNLYIQSREEITEDFIEAGYDRTDIFDNTLDIVDKIEDYTFYEGEELLPSDEENPTATLLSMCEAAAIERGLTGPEYASRLKREISVIDGKNFAPYFLVVEDLVRWSKENDILVGPGRGSAAGSLVCYLLGITNVNPIEYGLLFARFINEERDDYPDIDLDFPKHRRKDAKKYLADKYGHVASIATYNYYKDKNAIKDSARTLGVSYSEVENMSKHVQTMKDFTGSKNKTVMQFRTKYPEVQRLAERLVGRIRGSGMHAGGVVVAKEDISKYAPIETSKDPNEDDVRVRLVAHDMNDVADIGLIKFDILGLKNLDVIVDTLKFIGKPHEFLNTIDLNDPDVYFELGRGKTVGVFQCDTNPYTNLLMMMKPRGFEDLVASNALIRPGAMKTVGPQYIRRMQGEEEITYIHETVEEILKPTFGTIIYQEQVMQTAVKLGGMSWAEADKLRKIIGKKKDPEEFAKYKDRFMDGATKHISAKDANKLWSDFEAHAGYSFNRSHAVAYSMVSVWTAWFKNNYPVEFMCASLKNEDDGNRVTEFLIECKRLGIEVHLPDVNYSEAKFHLHDGGIRFGLTNIKYLSDKVFGHIELARPFESLDNLHKVATKKGSGINSRAREALLVTGSLLSIGGPEADTEQLYDFLNMPTFNLPDIADHVTVRTAATFHNKETFILSGMVSEVRRDKGWSLISVIDDTGSVGFFHSPDTEVTKGKYYYFIISGNRVQSYVSTEQFESKPDHPFVRYLVNPIDSLLDGRTRYVVQFKGRKTKAGKRMGSLFVSDEKGSIEEYVVFPNHFNDIFTKVSAGRGHDFKLSKTKSGSYSVEAAR